MGKRLYVGNLSFETMEIYIQELFGEAGTVTDCHLVTDNFHTVSDAIYPFLGLE